MTATPAAEPGGGPAPEPRAATGLADGAWHRLHPATPLLRGGIAFLALVGLIVTNLRERLIEFLLPIECPRGECDDPDPIGYLTDHGYLLLLLGGILAVVVVLLVVFTISWRMHTFRVTNEVVEVRSGVLFRTHRQARLDRIQGIDLARPFVARLFGAARLEIGVAGHDANVSLSYLGSAAADALRAEILRLASGAQNAAAPSEAAPTAGGSLLDRRLSELASPELDPALAVSGSVVRLHPGRLVASTFLSSTTVVMLLAAAAFVALITVSPEFLYLLFLLIPTLLGLVSYFANRLLKFLRYSIAATPDGVRIGFGLLSTRNDTLPPGRIHSIAVSQNLLWRPADWWTVTVNRATRSTQQNSNGQQNTVVLPVGTRADAMKVLELLLPDLLGPDAPASVDAETRDLLAAGLAARGTRSGFTTSPRRAAVLRWFSWRRNGFALVPRLALLRRGAIWRQLVLVPTPRVQSVSIDQGPLDRVLDLAGVHLHTVAGPISARLGALDRRDAEGFFRDAAEVAVRAAATDRSHRWRAGEARA